MLNPYRYDMHPQLGWVISIATAKLLDSSVPVSRHLLQKMNNTRMKTEYAENPQ